MRGKCNRKLNNYKLMMRMNLNFRYVAMIKQLDVCESKRSILCFSRRETFNGGDEPR